MIHVGNLLEVRLSRSQVDQKDMVLIQLPGSGPRSQAQSKNDRAVDHTFPTGLVDHTSCRNFLPLLHFAMAADELRKLPIRFQVCASPHHAAPAVAAANTTYNSRAHAPLQKLNSTSKSSWVRCAQYLCHHAAGTPANCAARQLPPVFSDCRRCTTARTCSAHLVLNHDAPTAHHVVVDAPLKSSTHAPAPFDTSSWYTAWRPLAAARCSGVDPPSFTAVTDAPACSRRAAALVRP